MVILSIAKPANVFVQHCTILTATTTGCLEPYFSIQKSSLRPSVWSLKAVLVNVYLCSHPNVKMMQEIHNALQLEATLIRRLTCGLGISLPLDVKCY